MARIYEGKVIVPLQDLWDWLDDNYIKTDDNTAFGVPNVNIEEHTLEITFAASSEGNPNEWTKKPVALKQWEILRKQKEVGDK